MKNKSKKRRLWEQVKYRLNSTYRGMVVRMMVGSKEADLSIIHRANRKFIDWVYG